MIRILPILLLAGIQTFGMSAIAKVQKSSMPESLLSDPRVLSVSNSQEWHRLLHYRKTFSGRFQSEVDGQGFFFAADGATNPQEELRASLKALFENPIVGKLEQPVHCAFPERARFLKEKFELEIELMPVAECKYFQYYMNLYNDPKSVTLVFSSAYPNNSASMFGHTFLKINSRRGSDLLDSGVNFAAAVAEDENPFSFVWFGLTGGYVGQWSFQPYYVKVHEYVNFESRDLWEYELTLNENETRRLLAHIWELEANSYFKYYFFDENCSYQVLAAIEAIRPDWNISYHHLHMIPGESIKNVMFADGVVKEVNYRPSHYNKMWTRYKNLNADERKEFQRIFKSEVSAKQSSSRLVLDALSSYLSYLKAEEPKEFEKKYSQLQEDVYLQRSQLGVATSEELEKQKVPMAENRPDWGHDPFAFEVGGGYRDYFATSENFARLKVKTAYHGLLNRDRGYSKYNHIDFPSAEFQWNDRSHELRLEEFVGLATTSIMPVNALRAPVSYRASVLLRTPREYLGCDNCYEADGNGGVGYTLSMFDDSFRVYALLGAQLAFGEHLDKGYNLALGPELGAIATLHENYKLWANYRSYCSVVHKDRCLDFKYLSLSQSLSLARNWEIHNINKWVFSSNKWGPQNYELGLNIVYLFR